MCGRCYPLPPFPQHLSSTFGGRIIGPIAAHVSNISTDTSAPSFPTHSQSPHPHPLVSMKLEVMLGASPSRRRVRVLVSTVSFSISSIVCTQPPTHPTHSSMLSIELVALITVSD